MKNLFGRIVYPGTLFLLAFVLLQCKTQDENSGDSTGDFKLIDKGFYQGKDGKLYIKTTALQDVKTDTWSKPFFREVPDVEISTYTELGDDGWYSKDRKHAYIHYGTTDGDHLFVIEEADAVTFEVIGYCWAKDKNHVYSHEIMLDGLCADSLVILCPETASNGQYYFSIVKDNDQVFNDMEEIKVDDVASFGCAVVPFDSTKTYLERNTVNDSATYYCDKNWIYKISGGTVERIAK